ncbi:MAG: FtsW/RodA/SpoVE family cell cycle protein, partial [Bacteroidales bacterium]|nr:FtsW/RodA/SpoVE family cell cycle protein [Bacteroidales bacterium]
LIIIIITHRLSVYIYSSLANLFFIAAIILLVLTLFLGVRINEATRWIEIPGTGFRLQSSDVAKVALIIYLSRVLSQSQGGELKNFRFVTVRLILPVAAVCLLIITENLSTALMIFGISILLLFIGRVPVKFLLAYAGIGIAGLVLVIYLITVIWPGNNRVQVWKHRVENFFSAGKASDDESYQTTQARIAIATGGLFGKAPGKSTQRNMLPQSNSDFIFAIIVEEYGLIFGAIPLILAYMVLLFRGIAIAKKCETAFPAFLVLGLTLMIVIQALVNMLVASGLFPVTGQTLPMISWGRTSVLVVSFSIGAILSVSRVNNARLGNEELSEEDKNNEGDMI